MLKNKRGQLTLADAPTVVLLVGLVFLIMATMAFIGAKYGDALISSEKKTNTVVNETSAWINTTGYTVKGASKFRAENFALTEIWSAQGGLYNVSVPLANATISSSGVVKNATATTYSNVSLSYTNDFFGTNAAFNVTEDLNKEIGNNTSIAGIILTISLVGIVLTVLIGVFLVTRGANAGRA